MSVIKITSVNCQGLNDNLKRRDVFQYFRHQNCSISCLTDTHFTLDMEQTVRVEWGYETYYSSFASNSRGIAIMFNNNFEFKVHEQLSDNNGNYLVLDISIEGKKITLLTIYGPNEDCPKFYENISDIISNLSNDVITVGDFNLV